MQEIVDRFEISLHAIRRGKERFSSAEWIDENGNAFDNGGFEQFVAKFYPEHAD